LGKCYIKGESVIKGEREAVEWIQKATDQEHVKA